MTCARYRPLDATLDLLSVRMVRALRHFDLASTSELAEAMGEIGNGIAFSDALRFHVANGRIEQVLRATRKPAYRVTDAGLAWLRRMLDRGQLPAFEGKAAGAR